MAVWSHCYQLLGDVLLELLSCCPLIVTYTMGGTGSQKQRAMNEGKRLDPPVFVETMSLLISGHDR